MSVYLCLYVCTFVCAARRRVFESENQYKEKTRLHQRPCKARKECAKILGTEIENGKAEKTLTNKQARRPGAGPQASNPSIMTTFHSSHLVSDFNQCPFYLPSETVAKNTQSTAHDQAARRRAQESEKQVQRSNWERQAFIALN